MTRRQRDEQLRPSIEKKIRTNKKRTDPLLRKVGYSRSDVAFDHRSSDDQSSAERRGRRLRIYYVAQLGRRPPRFAIQVNDRSLIQRDWAFHIENRLRAEYGLQGVPLVIDYVPRKGRRERRVPRAGRV